MSKNKKLLLVCSPIFPLSFHHLILGWQIGRFSWVNLLDMLWQPRAACWGGFKNVNRGKWAEKSSEGSCQIGLRASYTHAIILWAASCMLHWYKLSFSLKRFSPGINFAVEIIIFKLEIFKGSSLFSFFRSILILKTDKCVYWSVVHLSYYWQK